MKSACGRLLVLIAVFLVTMWIAAAETRTGRELLSQENWPVTVEEVVRDLLPQMTPYEKVSVIFTRKDKLFLLHFDLGLLIRNRYGLWRGNEKLIFSACGFQCHPDEASMKIIEAVWETLHT